MKQIELPSIKDGIENKRNKVMIRVMLINLKAKRIFMNINIVSNLFSSLMINIRRWGGRSSSRSVKRGRRWRPCILRLLLVLLIEMIRRMILNTIGSRIGRIVIVRVGEVERMGLWLRLWGVRSSWGGIVVTLLRWWWWWMVWFWWVIVRWWWRWWWKLWWLWRWVLNEIVSSSVTPRNTHLSVIWLKKKRCK